MAESRMCTQWREFPTREQTKLGLARACLILALSGAGALLLPVGVPKFLLTLLAVGAGISACLDVLRFTSRKRFLERIEFDERRLYRVWRFEPSGREERRVFAFDGLEEITVENDLISITEASTPRLACLSVIPVSGRQDFVSALKEAAEAKGVKVRLLVQPSLLEAPVKDAVPKKGSWIRWFLGLSGLSAGEAEHIERVMQEEEVDDDLPPDPPCGALAR